MHFHVKKCIVHTQAVDEHGNLWHKSKGSIIQRFQMTRSNWKKNFVGFGLNGENTVRRQVRITMHSSFKTHCALKILSMKGDGDTKDRV